MDRLTTKDERLGLYYPWEFNGINGCYDIDEDLLSKQVERLAAYEDAGLTPEEITTLDLKLTGVMHFVDKWLEGDELEQDEVSRADTMREKTLKLVESLQAEIDRLHKENFWLTAPKGSEWIALADKRPPMEGSYLVCTERGAVCTAHYWERNQRFSGRGLRVTHWMPMPKPHKEAK